MKICDVCGGVNKATFTIKVVEDDTVYDLCVKHKNEIAKQLSTREKSPKFGRKRDSAKAG